ncbi:MAG: T9SS type A sorting domain-containing protein [Bacteroidota bacterium]|nr:T9SS type A sorting domain-containing protein [Bacteroidota bacterium]
MKVYLILFFCLISSLGRSQNRNSVWCFGDSAGIDFGSGVAMPISSGMDGRGSCVSIADSNGILLFYAATMRAYSQTTSHSTFVYDATNSVMLNGDSIVGRVWYQELVIVPNPAQDSTYYLFSISVTDGYGLCYSVIDMRLNGGLGAVTLKNIQLQTFEPVDGINTIKHGNGRDWWLLYRKSDASTFTSNNDWYKYLITPDNINVVQMQSIGQQNRTNAGHIGFSSNGEKLVFSNILNVLELYNFDRCTGLLSNPIIIETDPGMNPYSMIWGSAFSSDGSKLYVTTNNDTSYLFQYDLNAGNIAGSKDTLWATSFPQYTLGTLNLAPDDKIYLSNQYFNGFNTSYPYADTVYNMYNMNLSVIFSPDSLGAACNFQPHSFYLGGKRAYLGLPNNPNYQMEPLFGSLCDSLTSISELPSILSGTELFVYYASDWQTAFINVHKLKGSNYSIEVFDLLGKSIFRESGKIPSTYYTKNLNCSGFSNGMYIVNFVTDKERLVKRFVIR